MQRLSKADLLTRYAKEATDLSVEFVKALGGRKLAPHGWVGDVTAPESVSTSDGAQATQHVRLVTSAGLPPIVIGSVHVKQMAVELRDHERVDALHRQRFGKPVELDRDAYHPYLVAVRDFFRERGFTVTMLTLTDSVRPPPPEPKRLVPAWATPVAILVVAAIVALVVATR